MTDTNYSPSSSPPKLLAMTRRFFQTEAAGGILLMIAAVVALMIANSPFHDVYHYILNEVEFTVGFLGTNMGDFLIQKPLLLWINDGFMAIFFFLVGLEIKREVLRGELSSRERALLPLLAAIGGMIVPALIFWLANQHHPENLRGWAIPTATDIAFALGVLALLGTRAPVSLKILLLAIAIIDDLGAVLIIAFFYTSSINMVPLLMSFVAFLGLVVLNRTGVMRIAPYILLGFILWVAMLKSGVHATIAGVMTAMTIPLSCPKYSSRKPLEKLEHALHPWVAFGVMPLFALANAGVSFEGIEFYHLIEPVTFGIMGGLVFGKIIGIFGMIAMAVTSGLCQKPEGANWMQILGLSCLCGVGFTMSLFIGELAYEDTLRQAEVRLGVLGGSIISALLAFGIFSMARKK
jgi:NhaA family Na+:H+ antiporter